MAKYLDETGLSALWERMKEYVYECCCNNSGGGASGESETIQVPENRFLVATDHYSSLRESTTVAPKSSARVALQKIPTTETTSVCTRYLNVDSNLTLALKGYYFEPASDGLIPQISLYNYGDADVTLAVSSITLSTVIFNNGANVTNEYCVLISNDCGGTAE